MHSAQLVEPDRLLIVTEIQHHRRYASGGTPRADLFDLKTGKRTAFVMLDGDRFIGRGGEILWFDSESKGLLAVDAETLQPRLREAELVARSPELLPGINRKSCHMIDGGLICLNRTGKRFDIGQNNFAVRELKEEPEPHGTTFKPHDPAPPPPQLLAAKRVVVERGGKHSLVAHHVELHDKDDQLLQFSWLGEGDQIAWTVDRRALNVDGRFRDAFASTAGPVVVFSEFEGGWTLIALSAVDGKVLWRY